jgi:two-component system chemotaxis response regulator CheB
VAGEAPERVPHRDQHDVVVVGASAGGVEALRRLIASVPADFPGTIFVVLHLPTNAHSFLPTILSRAGALPVHHAVDGQVAERGTIYVAPPDVHLLVKPSGMQLLRGPTENGHRPAVDPLFRSAAQSFGGRVIGIVLSGVLDDGTNGLLAISSHGGLTVAQSPEDALYPSMPQSAIDNVPVDLVAPADEIGSSLTKLVARLGLEHDRAPDLLADYTERALEGNGALEMDGRPSRFTCPDCGGSLWDADPAEPGKFRCRVGHSWTTLGLLEQQAATLEQALWTALRALSERADLARRMRDQAAKARHGYGEHLFEQQLEEYEAMADVVRRVLRSPEPIALATEDQLAKAFTAADVDAAVPSEGRTASP